MLRRSRCVHFFFKQQYSTNCSVTILATVAQSVDFPLFRLNAYPVSFMSLSHTVFDRKAVSSAQGHLFLLDPQYLAVASIASTKQLTSAYPQGLVLRFPRLSNSGAVVKSVVIIFIL